MAIAAICKDKGEGEGVGSHKQAATHLSHDPTYIHRSPWNPAYTIP